VRPVPSQRFAKHTLEDTPNYPQQVAEYSERKAHLSWRDRILPGNTNLD
jgi:hypothetical protein